jgi:hypothetical protein
MAPTVPSISDVVAGCMSVVVVADIVPWAVMTSSKAPYALAPAIADIAPTPSLTETDNGDAAAADATMPNES